MATPPRLAELRCTCGVAHWEIDHDYRGIAGEFEPYETRTYHCPGCGVDGPGFAVVQQSPPAFFAQPHPLYPMAEAEFDQWVAVLRAHFPDHPRLKDLGASWGPASQPARTCPTCLTAVGPADRYCGGCGRQLAGGVGLPSACPTCGGPLRTPAPRCSFHGEMDPSWLHCPSCLRAGQDGRLQQGERSCPICSAGPPSVAATQLCPVCGAAQFADASVCAVCGAPLDVARLAAEGAVPVTVAMPLPPPRSGPLAYLIETGGAQFGRAIRFHDPVTTIGRHPANHIVVDDELVGAVHAQIRREPDGRFAVTDRKSLNGTWLNGRKLTEPAVLRDNDELTVGTTTLVLKVVRPRRRRR